MLLYHATTLSPDVIENDETFKFDLNFVGSAKNGNNQAEGIHFSSDEDFAHQYLNDSGCIVSAEINVSQFLDYYNDFNEDVFSSIIVNIVGEEKISNLCDKVMDAVHKDTNPIIDDLDDLEERLKRALIYLDNDLMSTIKDMCNLTSDLEEELYSIISNSFEFEEGYATNHSAYNILSQIFDSRIEASKKLINEGVNGFFYDSPNNFSHENETRNYCILNTDMIKRIEVVYSPKKNKNKYR